MWPSRFMEQLPPAPGAKPQPFDFHTARQATSKAENVAAEPPLLRKPGLFATWRKRRHYRQELARLLITCPHMIADIGLTYEAAETEIARPFWRASPRRGYGVTTIGESVSAPSAQSQPPALVG
jgi:uncharacterized protein YjiS (DUF1127 family)